MIASLARACTAALMGTACTFVLSFPAYAATSLPLDRAVAALPQAAESRDGYERTKFVHWNAGAQPDDGCDTRNEVLIAEAIEPPSVGPDCALKGGVWTSYYDARRMTSAAAMDVDHMVPLPEAWDSGASQWTAARREAYANDLDDPRSLVAVSASAHRDKADQDPAQWLPSNTKATCRYIIEWTAVKLRWALTADTEERQSLTRLAEACPDATVTYTPAP
ncbi:GmrSD restriction endonuclease domain-containing protein [Streptomyces paradoxus]|uniref:GmrSD restriction endonuclease domain-containing protein n=1 Tax=Streptomyces paradoxus TaxID=66375 RepID=UPI0037D94F05